MEKETELIPHYLRTHGFEQFLVPESDIEPFDELTEKIEHSDEYSDEWYKLCDNFNNNYWKYKCEGELYDTKLFIEGCGHKSE